MILLSLLQYHYSIFIACLIIVFIFLKLFLKLIHTFVFVNIFVFDVLILIFEMFYKWQIAPFFFISFFDLFTFCLLSEDTDELNICIT